MTSGSDHRSGGYTAGTEFSVVAAFAAAWDTAAAPPRIADYLPDAVTLRRAALVELIRVDMRHRWLRRPGLPPGGRPPPTKRLREYCSEFSELTARDLPAGLVYEEFVIRRHSGETVDPRDCLREYPHQANELRELLNADDEDQSTRRTLLEESTLGGLTLAPTGPTLSHETVHVPNPFDGDSTRVPEPGEVTLFEEPPQPADAAPDRTRATGGVSAPDTGELLDRIEIGQRIDDFDLLTSLGSGAFARVFLARQRSLQRLVAVKISADHGTEPQTLAQLDHDYIVRVFDQRLMSDVRTESGRRLRLLYMQFLPGGTLLGVLRWVRATPPAERSGQLLLDAVDAAMEEKGEIRPTDSSVRAELAGLNWPETVAWLGRRLAEALDYADGHGVLHRDVKPANVLLTAEAVPKLADFNISFSRNLDGTSPVSYFGGSLSYMSPEQLEACHPGTARSAADLDTRADIFSLGVVLWELLTGAKPFDDTTAGPGDHGDRTTLEAMLDRRRGGVDSTALDRVPADCPAALRRVLLTCLEPARDQRWSSGAVLAKQLDLCLDQRARDLVDPPPHSWRMRLRPWLIPLVTLAVAIPNTLASLYNIAHNRAFIISHLSESAMNTFVLTTATVNLVFFPLGTAVIAYLCRYVIVVPRGLRKGREYDADTLRRARADVLLAGERISSVVFSLWVIAGFTFPVILRLTASDLPVRGIVHFLVSLVVCGAMAVAYPFFLVTFYLVRCVYPMFLRHGDISAEDAAWLHRLGHRCTTYLALAASIPLLAVAGVTFLPPDDIPQVIVAVRVLSVGGIAAFVAVYAMFRALEADLAALERVVSPARPSRESGSPVGTEP
ncbi:serine/threonine-protein kinase [Nocardia seriolae]|nr:serine/threonine-protein kinase [Nocardia seriolae]MTJ66617.1 protein kinase [Nocardia seriolae]MTJ71945.1 protein kinase [Nocardia seriolae]MTJ84746.1 protein kinase [Nocardia seriolae]MTK28734.1 protein kinase [Nocardia seriolae]MTK38346.1 protein kinase [Nocardia seriolae]